jgi:uncharacterized protein (TIGR02265 family)
MPKASRAIELVASHCDIVERLDLVPPSASVRGLWHRNIETQLERAGHLPAYRDYFGTATFAALTYYPLTDYIVRIACAGALMESPARVHEGMYLLARNNATAFAQSLLGRALFRLLARDPVRLSEQGLAARRQSHTYGHWGLVRHGPNEIEMTYEDEYQWIEWIVAGSAHGTFEACGLQARFETRLRSRFSGSTFVRW